MLGRVRAGVLEQGTVGMMYKAQVSERIEKQGMIHRGVNIAFDNHNYHIDIETLTRGGVVTVYGQTELTADLYAARDAMGGVIIHEASDIALHELKGGEPFVTFNKDGAKQKIDCEFIAGCDGFHGVCRQSIPKDMLTEYHLSYPFGWLGVLSETPPVSPEVTYASHERGFALCSMRNRKLSRYYIQVPINDSINRWSDQNFWEEFKARLPTETSKQLVTGPSIEKSIAPLRAFVADNLNYGRLFLAGDAGHIVPPTGAKGLNLAVSDIYYLSNALIDYYRSNTEATLKKYSKQALDRIWKTVRFSLASTKLLHHFPEHSPFESRIQQAERRYMVSSKAAMTAFAENYVGLPY